MNIDRSRIIGGSDIAAVMGLSRYTTPLALWAQKTGRLENDLSNFEAAEIGTELEEYVARKFTRKTGIKLRVDNRTFTHPKYPYMVAHIDRWVVGEDAVFEAKTCSAWKEKEWHGEEIPQEYILQLNWYLGIVGKAKGHIACLIGGQKFIWKEIQFDQSLFELQVEQARMFMEEYVLKDVAPVALAGDNETLGELFPTSNESTIQFNGLDAEEIDSLIEERTNGISVIKDAQADLKAVEARLKQKLGEAEAGETTIHRFTWKTINRKEFTVKASSYRQLKTVNKQTKEDA